MKAGDYIYIQNDHSTFVFFETALWNFIINGKWQNDEQC